MVCVCLERPTEKAKASKQLVNLNEFSHNCLEGLNFFTLKSWENPDFQVHSSPKKNQVLQRVRVKNLKC